MIKKLIAPLALVVLLCAACQKEGDVNPNASTQSQDESGTNNRLTIPPTTFTQKLLIEMFGTAYCATCPDMEQKCRIQMANHPNRVYGYVAHNADAMDFGLYDSLNKTFPVATYASGALNRTLYGGKVVMAKQYWNTYVNTALAKVATCGVQITSSINGTTASVTVDAGFNATMAGTYKLTTIIYQDSIIGVGSGYNQSNYYNGIVSSIWYGLGNPIIGYKHDFVSRKVLSSTTLGDAISATYIHTGGMFTKTYSVNIGAWNPRQLYVVAFINKIGTTSTTHEVMNVQSTKLGTSKNFD